MQFYTVQQASAGLGEVIARAVNDHEEAANVSECGAVVLIPQDEFESMRETLRLLSDPCALHALLEGHAERDAGSLTEVPSVEQVFHDLQASHS